MPTFTIDTDNNITALANPNAATAGTEIFSTQKQLAGLAANWPIARLVAIWNSFAGCPPFGSLKPVKRFENRQKAVARIWKACAVLAATLPAEEAPAKASAAAQVPKGAPKAARSRKATVGAPAAPKGDTKKLLIVALLKRAGGATLPEIMVAAGWQAHSVRGFIAGAVKKAGFTVESTKNAAGERTYAITA